MNTAIKAFLSHQLAENKSAFLATIDLHPLLEQFKEEVLEISIEESVAAFSVELEENIQYWWTNPEKVDVEAELSAILFEYSDMRNESEIAEAYGINKLTTPLVFQVEPYDNIGYFDFAEGFYTVPGVTLKCCDSLNKLAYHNVDEDKYGEIEICLLEGYERLMNVYMYNAYLSLHLALQHLYDQGKLDRIRKKAPFYFLIGEHDTEMQSLFVI
ncbi:hypothetical protein [Chitinophaga arvensicola]|uniref:Uncharacterized protein n=1 Tax=Chitinophaga arvensicola TaxID=29529 RepID=A0A1I0S8C9_9BACT|nr:hypothetical protein [Chitinophaga arvensicola]SEW52334.1 hypothetical protein SAMN04488122_4773 [Chitinophaga arvensicola]